RAAGGMSQPLQSLCVVSVSILSLMLVLMMQGCTASTSSSTPDPPAGDATAPTAPTNLQTTAASNTQIGLSWTASTDNVGVTGYRVERCLGNTCTSFVQIASVAGTTFSDNGLLSGTSYGYRVRAIDAAGHL